MHCHLQFPRTVNVYYFISNNMILFKTLSTASIKSIVLEPHSGSVIGRREGYLHCIVYYINPQWEQTLPHTFRNQSAIIVQGKLITATKYPTMTCHLVTPYDQKQTSSIASLLPQAQTTDISIQCQESYHTYKPR